MCRRIDSENMIYAILDNIIMIVLTGIGLITGKSPELLLMLASMLMVLITCESFYEDKSRALIITEWMLMAFFAVLSGGCFGYAVFFLLKAVREHMRMISGMGMFFGAALLIYKDITPAMLIVELLLLAAVFLLLTLTYDLVEYMEKRKLLEGERLTASNVSELHEKRLNAQLVMQNFLAEKNARLVERENVSRNIHNSVGHSITAAVMALEAADVLYDERPEEARKRMNDANVRIRGSLEAIRRAVRVLDEENTEISAGDLKCEIENIINEFMMDTDMHVDWDFSRITDGITIPNDHAVFLTGALQELLTNGAKHGKASEFLVFLLGDAGHIRLEVSDNGHSDFDMSIV